MLKAMVLGTGIGCQTHVHALRGAGFDVVALVGRDAARTAGRAERTGVPAPARGNFCVWLWQPAQ